MYRYGDRVGMVGAEIMTIAVLTLGTLAAAGMLGLEGRRADKVPTRRRVSGGRTELKQGSAHRGDVDRAAPRDIVDQWGLDSFPASDPPANW